MGVHGFRSLRVERGRVCPDQNSAAIVEAPGGALYFKMVGPKNTVTQAEVGFATMLATVQTK